MTASVRGQALEIAGVRVRRLNIVVSGHTLQQLAATHRYDTVWSTVWSINWPDVTCTVR